MFSVLVTYCVAYHSKRFETITISYFSWFYRLVGWIFCWSHLGSLIWLYSVGGLSGLVDLGWLHIQVWNLNRVGWKSRCSSVLLYLASFSPGGLQPSFFIAWWSAPKRVKLWQWHNTLLPNSFGQSRSWCQSRDKEEGNRRCLLVGGEAHNMWPSLTHCSLLVS